VEAGDLMSYGPSIKTTKALALTIPQSMPVRADEVIQAWPMSPASSAKMYRRLAVAGSFRVTACMRSLHSVGCYPRAKMKPACIATSR
jgi:hypothetical protein